jgi:hypothetical protein
MVRCPVTQSVEHPSLTIYPASRKVIYQSWGGQEHISSFDKVKASSIAGGFAGMMGGLLREYSASLMWLKTL